MEKIKPSYYSITPATVRYDTSISDGAIKMYGEISCLTNKYGYCNASNKYFSDLYKTSEKTVSRWVSELVRAGHIRHEMVGVKKRKLYLSTVSPQ